METQSLHNCQFDFIKVKTQKVNRESVNWKMLNEHSTIKNAYTLDARSELHGKNFKLYFTKGDCAILETSVPYLLYGHNYIGVIRNDLEATFNNLQDLVGLDFMNSEILQFEYGGFVSIERETKDYIKDIVGVDGYDLKFSSPYMKMYGYRELHFKIYDAVANGKLKKTYTLGDYPDGKLIKYEVKWMNVTKHFKTVMTLRQLSALTNLPAIQQSLLSHISMIKYKVISSNFKNKEVKSLNEILFLALSNLQEHFDYSIYEYVMDLIHLTELTPSQKSKRRKSFITLEEKFKTAQAN